MPSQEDYLDQLLKEMESGLNDDVIDEDASEIEMPEEALSLSVEADELKAYEPEVTEPEVSESESVIFETEPEMAETESEAFETESEAFEVESEAPEIEESDVFEVQPEMSESELEVFEAESEMHEAEHEVLEPESELPESGAADTEMPEIDITGAEEQDHDIMESEPEKAEASDDFDMSDMDELLQFAKDISEDDDEDETDDAMSEEEIEKLLNQSRLGDAVENQGDEALSDDVEQDLMNLLNDASSDSDDLQDIHDMLQKSDNNEAVDASVLEVPGDEMNPWENGTFGEGSEENGEDEFAGMSERQKKALLKKREKEEKAAQKKAEKEAKKAEKLAKKAEKEAAKKAAKEAKKQTAPAGANGESVGLDMAAPEMAEDAVSETPALEETASEAGGTPPEVADGLEFSQAEIDALLGGDMPVVEPSLDEPDSPQDESESTSEEKGDKKGKKSLIARIIEFLTEEDEDEEDGKSGTEDIPLSDENKNILEEMDQEDKGKKGKKAKKPKKDKKGKDAKNADDGDEDEEGGSGKGKDKKKPKKEKKPKPVKEKEPVDSRNRITFKKLLPVILTCVSLLLAVVLLVYLGGDFLVKQEARRAFYQEDYETCYQELYGKKLNETEQVMLGKSESILRIRLWMREYELFAEEGSEVEALDVLIQAANDYSGLYEYAQKWNAQGDISVIYSQMLEILSNKYRLSEAQALEIAAEPDDVEYTRKVTTAANGGGYTSAGQGSASVDLPDMLPEEKQFPENSGGQ